MWPLHQQITEPVSRKVNRKLSRAVEGPALACHPWVSVTPGAAAQGWGPVGSTDSRQPHRPQTCVGQGLAWGCKRAAAYTATSVTVGERTLDPQVMSAW